MDRRRVAFHEAGHLVMALILRLDVLGCDISRRRAKYTGELGRCTVFDPDPVGVRKFLLAMGGIMAETHFFSDDMGGIKDRVDAFAQLRRFLSHYNHMPGYDTLKPVLEEASDLFYTEAVLDVLEEAADLLTRKVRIGPEQISSLREKLERTVENERLVMMLSTLEDPPDPLNWKEIGHDLLKKGELLLKKIRKM